MSRNTDPTRFPAPSDEDLARARALLKKVGGPNVAWGATNVMDVLVGEHRLAVEEKASRRLMRATWVLAGATIVLAAATVALIFATLAS